MTSKELKEIYPVSERFENLMTQINSLLSRTDVHDKVYIDGGLLGKAVLDYFEDIDRLKNYEEIIRTNVDKIYGYEVYWLLKRCPIQILESYKGETATNSSLMFINEKICVSLIISKMLSELNISPETTNNDRMRKFIMLLFYNFKYRDYTQKTLELMVESFFCGYCMNIDEDVNGETYVTRSRIFSE